MSDRSAATRLAGCKWLRDQIHHGGGVLMSPLRKAAAAAGGLAVAAGIVASPAPSASAMTQDEYLFVDAVKNHVGINDSGGDYALLDVGYTICRSLNTNHSAPSIASDIARNGTSTYQDAKSEILFATLYLCTEQIVNVHY